MQQASRAPLTLDEACERLGLDAHSHDLQAGLQAAFMRAVKAARIDDTPVPPDHYRTLLDAYRFLRALAPAQSPEERRFEVWPTQLVLTPIEAVKGGMKTGRLPTGRPFTTRVPPGLRDGDLIWALGWLVLVKIEDGEDLVVKGDDLWITARKPASSFKPGHRIGVETPMGPWSFRLSEAAVEQRLVRVPGAGLPAARKHPAGDLYVRFELEAETEKSAAALLRRLVPLRAA